MIKWSEHPEYVRFMKKIIPGHTEPEIKDAFKKKYGIMLTDGQIGGFKNKHHVKSGTNGGRWVKGQVARNKGQKMPADVYARCQPTMFKKGHMTHNHKPVGSERISRDGYIEIKVEEPKRWEKKHRVIYERYYGVKLGRNDAIIFLDGNRLNLDIENLVRMTRSELVRYNQMKLHGDNPDLNMSAVLLAKIKAKQGRKENEND